METTIEAQAPRRGVYDDALDQIIGAVAGTFAVSPDAIVSPSRRREVQTPRHAIYLIATQAQIPPRAIMTRLRRVPSTYNHYRKTSTALRDTDPWFAKLVTKAQALCS